MKYCYIGPISGVTLQKGEEAQEEVMLHPGAEVELPQEHEYTRTLLALGHLTPVKPAARTPTRTSAGTDEPAAKGA
ncbi:hypothetical protein D5041_07895 [Verminephrobacter aporrectodeae subsp. tuberculatae]|uniref:hypothetical protein n=1 Tax=Verminephrobacter aporrectodeae TaxID=1110389 RepID=UPI0022382741|nr:hypothetical protein [Verminephrobacter aporrectodeae]MCW5223519.1 hypothetical protein [Verminephrobacter aporrectodeae subsp. tuberculatae]MCW5288984.1 hypothetical protein [Verminephrobacter aporrectodeae subsp. tuberculatae]